MLNIDQFQFQVQFFFLTNWLTTVYFLVAFNAQNGFVSTCEAMLEVLDCHNLVNGKDFSGRTPIHLAAAAGQYHVLIRLTAVPYANIEPLDNEGRYYLKFIAYIVSNCLPVNHIGVLKNNSFNYVFVFHIELEVGHVCMFVFEEGKPEYPRKKPFEAWGENQLTN